MSAIHRVDDIYALPAQRFFPWATRLPAYPGVMQVRAQNEQEAEEEPRRSPTDGVPEVPLEVALAHQGFKGDGRQFPPAFEWSRGGAR